MYIHPFLAGVLTTVFVLVVGVVVAAAISIAHDKRGKK